MKQNKLVVQLRFLTYCWGNASHPSYLPLGGIIGEKAYTHIAYCKYTEPISIYILYICRSYTICIHILNDNKNNNANNSSNWTKENNNDKHNIYKNTIIEKLD